jgi:hypothetical protein
MKFGTKVKCIKHFPFGLEENIPELGKCYHVRDYIPINTAMGLAMSTPKISIRLLEIRNKSHYGWEASFDIEHFVEVEEDLSEACDTIEENLGVLV